MTNASNPLVSIIVRTKDRPKLLRRALHSIANQTYRPIEVVLVNSGGFDCSFEIYEDWDLLIRLGENYPFHHIEKTTADYNQWDTEQQISQSNKDYRFIEQSYLRILSKHWDKVTEKRIRNCISHLKATIKDKRTSIATKDSYIKLCSKTRYGQRMRP